MELFWILFGLGYGAYRNVKDTLPIKKTDGAYTHTTFQTYFALPIWLAIAMTGVAAESICGAAAQWCEDTLDHGRGIGTLLNILAIVIGIAALIWFLFGPFVAAKWARQVEQRIALLSGREISPKEVSPEQSDVLSTVVPICIIVMIIAIAICIALLPNKTT